ncbi:hypothetical protein [Paenibacillus lutrae]|uniref:Peptidase MA-like domain-containing protein n=1 Tax=Paenibacillus lutrae TaxID=2078573 RepID=A0A7X3K252_9BACL|nr:hypothetical protein [Paenibacillus lutrae]MVP02556.1 hypothetical protein [Paenibacillus lutrae]
MKFSKKRDKFVLFASLLLAAAVLIQLTMYAEPARAVMVNYSNLNLIAPDVYVEPGLLGETQDELMSHLHSSDKKIAAVFGKRTSTPYLIYVESQNEQKKYAKNPTGQTYYYPWKNYIVIGPKGLNENVISHEFAHAELRERLNNKNKVPVWFDEGLAAMIDGRYTTNESVWKQLTNDGTKPINYDELNSHQAFSYGTKEAWNHYNLASYEVNRWYTLVGEPGLNRLISELNDGKDFKEQYKIIESEAKFIPTDRTS